MKTIEIKRKKLEYTLQFIWCCNLIVITNIIGRTGMECFGFAYEIYMLFYILTISSFPAAILKLTKMRQQKEKYADSKKVMNVASLLAVIYAVFGSLLLYLISHFVLEGFIQNSFAGVILKLLIPIYVCQCLLQILTGYFQAKGSPAAVILVRILEAVITFVCSIFIALSLREYGSKVSALLLNENLTSSYGALSLPAAFACGSVLGILLFLLILLMNKRNLKESKLSSKSEESVSYLGRLLLRTMLPYTAIAFLYRIPVLFGFVFHHSQLISSGDSDFVTDYGLLYGIYLPFLGAFILLSGVFALGKVYQITASMKKQEYKRAKEVFQTWVHLLIILSGFLSIFVIALSNSFAGLLFSSDTKELIIMLQVGGISIMFGAFAVFFSQLLITIKKFQKILFSLVSGVVVFIATMILLSRFGNSGVFSFVYAWDAFWGVLALVSGYFACKALKVSLRLKDIFFIPVISLLVIGIALIQFEKLLLHMLGNGLCIVISLILAIVVHFGILAFSHNMTKEELGELPLGKYILIIGEKLHLLS